MPVVTGVPPPRKCGLFSLNSARKHSISLGYRHCLPIGRSHFSLNSIIYKECIDVLQGRLKIFVDETHRMILQKT